MKYKVAKWLWIIGSTFVVVLIMFALEGGDSSAPKPNAGIAFIWAWITFSAVQSCIEIDGRIGWLKVVGVVAMLVFIQALMAMGKTAYIAKALGGPLDLQLALIGAVSFVFGMVVYMPMGLVQAVIFRRFKNAKYNAPLPTEAERFPTK